MRRLDSELERLNERLLEMGALVASSVHRAARSLIEKDHVLAHQVIRDEARVDQMEIQIDDIATSMIALTQPVARDMRFVTVAIKINTDLERMGDLAVGIVERSLALMRQPPLAPVHKITELAQIVESMVLQSLDAFVKRDCDAAESIIVSDDGVDRLRNEIAEDLVGIMEKDTSTIRAALDLLLIARQLERVADHATNIAEDLIFLINGQDVRHLEVERPVEEAETYERAEAATAPHSDAR